MGETVFFRMLDAEDKEAALAGEIAQYAELTTGGAESTGRTFAVTSSDFRQVPGSPLAYWSTGELRELFRLFQAFEGEGRTALVGLQTSDDFRFVRLWWEHVSGVSGSSRRWFPFAKGGRFSRFYADVYLVVGWADDGSELKAWTVESYGGGHWSRNLRNVNNYCRPGLTWALRTQLGLALRAMPKGCIFGHKGPAAFVEGDGPQALLALLAVTNSVLFRRLVDLQMAFGSFEVGVIQRTPVPKLDVAATARLASLAKESWALKRAGDTTVETSHALTGPAILQAQGATIQERLSAWGAIESQVLTRLQSVQTEIDSETLRHYGITEDSLSTVNLAADAADVGEGDEETEDTANPADAKHQVAALMSYAVGACFGRWDIRKDVVDGRPQPEPFDALPVCSPGMLQGDDGLPLAQMPAGYPLSIAVSGFLVDDPGHPSDISAASRRVFDVLFSQDTEARWSEAGELLGVAKGKPEEWLRKEFFAFHLQQYSRSRRKAPIYWQLATSSARYSVWLYLPRLTRDTLFNVLDVVKLKLLHEEGQLEALRRESAAQRKALDFQESFVEELRTFRDEVARVAPLWNPNLDDGVLINFAPLWRLVPQHRAWQKECKGCWEELAEGEYDWAHLAMHLWPERVVPKCREDRSLAIAHGLEDVFWFEDEDGKWKPRPEPTRSIESLVEERTSPAVKTARDNLLSAAAPVGMARRAPSARAKRGTSD